jgi:hypothetical protein
MFSIIKEMPLMTALLLLVWLPAIIITLLHLFKRTDINFTAKVIWLLVGLIPILGLITYGVVNFKERKSIILTTFFAIVASAGISWYFISYMPKVNRRDVTQEQSLIKTPLGLIQEFQQNEDEANAKYINKAIELTGIVNAVETSEIGTIIFLQTGVDGTSLSCQLKTKEPVNTNANVTVKGILTGFIAGQLQLTEAVILSSNNTTVTQQPQPIASVTDTNKNNTTTVNTATQQPTPTVTYKSTSGKVQFFSETPAENIQATNTQIVSSITGNGNVVFAALIKGFRFENELMQKHFNEEGYMHSDKYPKAEFKGIIEEAEKIDFSKEGTYNVTAKGSLTMHGVTKPVTAKGTIVSANKTLKLNSKFKVHVQDYNIDGSDVADQIEITVECLYK